MRRNTRYDPLPMEEEEDTPRVPLSTGAAVAGTAGAALWTGTATTYNVPHDDGVLVTGASISPTTS